MDGSAAGEDLPSLEQLSLLSPAGFCASGVTKKTQKKPTFSKITPLSAACAQVRSLLEVECTARAGACLVLPQLRQDFHSMIEQGNAIPAHSKLRAAK